MRRHYGRPGYRPACGLPVQGRAQITPVKADVDCRRCKTTLQWRNDWYADVGPPLAELDTRIYPLLHMSTRRGSIVGLCGEVGDLTLLDNRVTCRSCNDMLALVPKRSGQPWAGPLRVALAEALNQRTFLIQCDLEGEWLVCLCAETDLIEECGFGPTAEAAMRHALGEFMRSGQ